MVDNLVARLALAHSKIPMYPSPNPMWEANRKGDSDGLARRDVGHILKGQKTLILLLGGQGNMDLVGECWADDVILSCIGVKKA